MTAIVTGATGFIGGHLVDALVEAGESVRCLVRRPGSVEAPLQARFYLADFSIPSLGLGDEVFANVDVVYHVAGATRATSEEGFHEANVNVTRRLLDRLKEVGARTRFVYISSQAAAGPAHRAVRRSTTTDMPLTEDDTPTPIEAYGRSKLAAEQLVTVRSNQLPVTIVRPVAVYGPRDRDFLSIFRWVRRGIAVYPGIRDAVVTTIYVHDLVRGIIAAGTSEGAVGRTYFMGSGEFANWRAIYRMAAEVMGKGTLREVELPLGLVRAGGAVGDFVGRVTRRPLLLNSSKATLAEPRSWTCSSQRAREELGFVATTRLQDGLRATYDWYVSHHWL
jgi:nucleoside-diphosphate-sugar epimerase